MKVGDTVKINAGPFDSQKGQTGRVEDARMQKCYWLEENPDYEEMTFFVRGDWYFEDELVACARLCDGMSCRHFLPSESERN